MRKIILFFFLIIVSFTQGIKAQSSTTQVPITLSDTAQISLLTSSTWDKEIYALFGHTAIRVCDTARNIDYVFNYGVFDFNSSNFLFRFVRGETDYMVGVVDYVHYIDEYKRRNVGVVEQVFNLHQKEKQDIFEALTINSLPENRVYRYNFFYDNCATRPRDIIERYIEGTVQYTSTNKNQTYRDLIWECVYIQPWTQFGIDLVIGAGADKAITDRQKDFLPVYLMSAYKGSTVKSADGTQRNFILKENRLLDSIAPSTLSKTLAPIYVGCLLLLTTILISVLCYVKRWFALAKTYDTILFFTAGLSGCVILFLMFFSEHPCTNPNWNIIWLNPLQLIAAFLFFTKSSSKLIYLYHFINFVALLVFLLAWSLIPQQLEIAFIPFILSICIRSVMNIVQRKKSTKRAVYSLPKSKW